jgi:chromosome segregation ATPase
MLRSITTMVSVTFILFTLAGCKISGEQATEYQLESVKQLRTSLDTGSKQIDATMGALEQLTATTTGDLKPGYQKFKTELAKLDADAATTRSRTEAMKVRAQEHLKMWEDEMNSGMTNPELRKISEEQRTKARERFAELRATTETGRDAYRNLSSDLHQIQKALDINLNASGVAALKPVVDSTKADAQVVQKSITEIVAKLDKVTDELSSTTAAPAPASGPAAPSTSP